MQLLKLTKKQQVLYDQVKIWHKGQTRKKTKEAYFDGHLVPVALYCMSYKLPYGFEVGILHDTLEDVKLFEYYTKGEEYSRLLLQSHMLAWGYTKHECKFIIDAVVALTDYYCPKFFPGLDRRSRKKLETQRLLNLSSVHQNYKLCDILHNVGSAPLNPSFQKIYLAEKLDYVTTVSKHIGIGLLNPMLVKHVLKTIKDVKKKSKEKKNGKKGD